MPSTYYQVLRYPSPHDMMEIKGDQLQSCKYEAIPEVLEKVKQNVIQSNDEGLSPKQKGSGDDQSVMGDRASCKDKGKDIAI